MKASFKTKELTGISDGNTSQTSSLLAIYCFLTYIQLLENQIIKHPMWLNMWLKIYWLSTISIVSGFCCCCCFFCFVFFFSNLYTQHGTQTQDPKIKSCMVFRLSQPGAVKSEALPSPEKRQGAPGWTRKKIKYATLLQSFQALKHRTPGSSDTLVTQKPTKNIRCKVN